MSAPLFSVLPAEWNAHCDPLRTVRRAVFVDEQGVPEALEWDELDGLCRHVLAVDARGEGIGAGRLTPDGRIGRMAVLKAWRGKGVGSAILVALLQAAEREGRTTVTLHAQTHAIGFYARHGFAAEGPEFLEADIPHRMMSLILPGRPSGRQMPAGPRSHAGRSDK